MFSGDQILSFDGIRITKLQQMKDMMKFAYAPSKYRLFVSRTFLSLLTFVIIEFLRSQINKRNNVCMLPKAIPRLYTKAIWSNHYFSVAARHISILLSVSLPDLHTPTHGICRSTEKVFIISMMRNLLIGINVFKKCIWHNCLLFTLIIKSKNSWNIYLITDHNYVINNIW